MTIEKAKQSLKKLYALENWRVLIPNRKTPDLILHYNSEIIAVDILTGRKGTVKAHLNAHPEYDSVIVYRLQKNGELKLVARTGWVIPKPGKGYAEPPVKK